MKQRASARPPILVVDDSVDNRDILVEYLQFRGFDVHAAATGAEALSRTQVIRPRIILMDISMPGIDGLEATRRLKADQRTSEATIIAVTARALTHEKEAAEVAGCDAFIAKPFDLKELADLIGMIVGETARVLRSTSPRSKRVRNRPRRP